MKQLTLVLVTCITCVAGTAHAQMDLVVGWEFAGGQEPGRLTWQRTPPLSSAAIEDLTALRDAFGAIQLTARAPVIEEQGGVSLALQARCNGMYTPEIATGVTVWPDWRVVKQTISFPDASQIKFLSRNHAKISHRPKLGERWSKIVDLRLPESRFQFGPGYQLNTLRVTDAGMWACLLLDGKLCVGQFNPTNMAGAVMGEVAPITGEIHNMMWRKDGRLLIIERPGRVLEVYRTSGWALIARLAGGWLDPGDNFQQQLSGRDSFFGGVVGRGACFMTVASDGSIATEQWPHQLASEGTVRISPNRKFVVTQKRDWTSFVTRYDRLTPYATANDVVPQLSPSVAPLDQIAAIGFLRWEP